MVEASWIRAEVVRRILEKFKAALPLYADMMEVASAINQQAGEEEAERLGKVMHAAIRCASPQELRSIRDMFSLMKSYPVNYYDLRERVSVESTAFRPTCPEEIESNGFRVFCSMLSIECVEEEHREFVQSIIERRSVFDEELLALIQVGQQGKGFTDSQAERFVHKSVELFTRPEEALVSYDEYLKLVSINKVAAQVLVSNSLAFNHLTPSVASVPAAHDEMQHRGIRTIPVWQGPVGKDVILRQTSCLAPPVELKFPNANGGFDAHPYQETFVEFEERLQALTRKGRVQFETMFAEGKSNLSLPETHEDYAMHYYQTMKRALESFPSDPFELWRENLAYFTYEISNANASNSHETAFEDAVNSGSIRLVPQRYEDFFGPAATNIFNSNIGLDEVSNVGIAKPDSLGSFEEMLGREVVDMYDYYDGIEHRSKMEICERLGIRFPEPITE